MCNLKFSTYRISVPPFTINSFSLQIPPGPGQRKEQSLHANTLPTCATTGSGGRPGRGEVLAGAARNARRSARRLLEGAGSARLAFRAVLAAIKSDPLDPRGSDRERSPLLRRLPGGLGRSPTSDGGRGLPSRDKRDGADGGASPFLPALSLPAAR